MSRNLRRSSLGDVDAMALTKAHAPRLGTKIGTAAASIVLILLVLEVVVFRFVLPASDFPMAAYSGDVIRHQPGQVGVYRVRNEIAAQYRINANGWNSGHAAYSKQKTLGKRRVAIIGDSFVEALQVDYDQSLAEELERLLGPKSWEVYRFGISGAPVSQYLQMLRREVIEHLPDIVVIVLIHNDFEESHNLLLGRYTRSFLRLDVGANPVREIQPVPFSRPWYAYLRATATYGYIVDRQRVSLAGLKRVIFRLESSDMYEANISIQDLEMRMSANERAADHVFAEFRKIADERDVRTLLCMDGIRSRIYRNPCGLRGQACGAAPLSQLASCLADRHGLLFLDLQAVFEEDYEKHHRRFDFEHDGHWNEYGHEVVARCLYQWVQSSIVEPATADCSDERSN